MSKPAAAAASSSSGVPTESVLAAAVKLASEKPLQHRTAGMGALTQLLTSHWANLTTNVNAAKAITPLLRDTNTFINHYAAINDENIGAYLPFYPALLAHHFAFLQKSKLDEPSNPLYVTLVKLMLHTSHKIRRPIVAMVNALLQSGSAHMPTLAGILLRTFHFLLYSKNTATLTAPNGAFIWSRALLTIAQSPVNVPLSLFLASDPALRNEDARRPHVANRNFEKLLTVWALPTPTFEKPAPKKQPPRDQSRRQVVDMVAQQLPAIEQLVFSERGLLAATGPLFQPPTVASSASAPPAAAAAAAAAAQAQNAGVGDLEVGERNSRQRATSVGLLVSLFGVLPTPATSSLLPRLYDLLSHPDFDKLTAESVAIFKHPEGTLCDFLAEGEFRAVAGENKNVKKEKDWTEEDERLARQAEQKAKQAAALAAAAAAKKPGAKPAAGGKPGAGPAGKAPVLTGQAKVDFENEQKLLAQGALRAKLRAAKEQVTPVLSVFGLLAGRQPKLIHAHLDTLLPKLHALFANEIVREAAIEAHRQCVHCLDRHVANIGSRLSLSVEAILLSKEKVFTSANQKRLLANTLVELRSAAQRQAFSPHTFLYIFPILQSTILASADPPKTDIQEEKVEVDEDDEVEFKKHEGGAKNVKSLEADDDEEEGEDDDEEEESESKEEKSNDQPTAAAVVDSIPETTDVEKPLAPGLQLSLSSASEVLNIHCAPSLHESPADELKEPERASVARFPISAMYSALLHILGRINTLYQPTLDALVSLSSASGVTADDVLPLLGAEGVLSPNEQLRLNSLQGLEPLRCFSQSRADREKIAHFQLFTQRVWIACHDLNAEVSAKAASVWEKFALQITAEYLDGLIALLTSQEVVIRTAVGVSIASAIQLHPSAIQPTLQKMTRLFVQSPDEVISSNNLGLRQAQEHISRWHTRSGIALAIGACTDSVTSTEVLKELFTFFIQFGLKDMNDRVWEDVLNATLRVINIHGKQHMDVLLPQLEGFLKADAEYTAAINAASAASSSKGKGKAAPAAAAPPVAYRTEAEEAQNDRLREGVILSMGTLARHMGESDGKVTDIVDSLVESLRTPSHSVQKSVSESLAPLMAFPAVAENAGKWIDILLARLHQSEDFGERKGAAFGLAAMVKGLKLASLKKYNILDQLAVMVQDKNSMRARQGALFAYERLFFELGSRFEPYAVQVLPFLLACYGDTNIEVREATQDAAKMVMSNLTGHGIKIVLPIVLRALEEKAWRTKLESIGLLSAMAYCSPTQLSACLPMIVPRLLEVNADANAKVQTASRSALRQIGSVIKNPEVLSLVPVLLAALNDPTVHTKRALQDLMRTSFVHSVDPPSLALIIPILRKGLKGRTAVTKKMSAQVVGSMCSLIGDVKDILPYSSTLLKYLKIVLVDPNPEVRAVAARALAALYKGIVSEEVEGFTDLREYLLETLRSQDTTPTIRSGCAQGVAQLLAVQGLEPTSQLLPTLFAETKSDRAVVREGFYNVFSYLPEAFGQVFSIFVADVLPVIVEGLADEIGLVREAALAAGQSLVLNFAQSKTDLLLPALEDGIVNADWRIRLSSVQLLGIMLLRLAGVSVRMIVGANNHSEEGEGEGSSAATICTRDQENHIESVLGTERRNRLISTVYLMRCDVVPAVADLAFRVWKSIVSNSPRMLTTILPVLMSLIISDLASTSTERQSAAGRTLGELVQRFGDFILAEIVPILQTRLSSDDKFTRQGVCLGLSEVMASSRKADLAAYMADLVPSVRDALCDNEELVRKAAGVCFHTLLRNLGKRAVDDIVPALLRQLDEEQGDDFQSGLVLEGIKVVLSINSSDVLPYLVPALASTPLTLYHAKALAFLSANISKGFIRYVEPVTLALIDGLGRCSAEDLPTMRVACAQVVLCISQDCVHQFVNCLEETSQTTRTASVKQAVAHLVSAFTANTKTDFDSHLPLLLQIVLRLFVEEAGSDLLQAGWDALNVMMKTVPEERSAKHIAFVRTVISDLSYNNIDHMKRTEVPGFNLKNGLAPLLPMFQYGLMHGSASVRVDSADGLSDLIGLTSESALAPFVIKMTGPLIRIVGDRFPAEVKAAILNTMYLLIVKCAKSLKPFLPQLQSTFIKALSDPNALVRSRGGLALAELITDPKIGTKVLAELATGVASDVNPSIKTSMLEAMVGIVAGARFYPYPGQQPKGVGAALAPDVIVRLTGLASDNMVNDKDSIRRECARLLAVTSPFMTDGDFAALVNQRLMAKSFGNWRETDGALTAIQAIARISGARLVGVTGSSLLSYLLAFLEVKDQHAGVVSAAILALGELMLYSAKSGDRETVVRISTVLAPYIMSDVAQIRQDTASRFQLLGEQSLDGSVAVYDSIVPHLLGRSNDSNGPARSAVCGAMHTLFQFHQPDFEAAEKLLGAYHARALKKDAGGATALLQFMKKSVARATVTPVVDELWKQQQGESIADPSAAVSSGYADEEADE